MQESKIKWTGISSNLLNRFELANKVAITEVKRQDNFWFHLDEHTLDIKTIFTTVLHVTRPYEFPDKVHLSISYELDLNKNVFDRAVYTFLDWLGDVGGLMGILFDIGTLVLMFIVGNALSYTLVSEVFKEPGNSDGSVKDDAEEE